jgi:hypothetical protein
MKTSVSVVGELDFELHSVPEARQAIFSVLRRRSLQSTTLFDKAKLVEMRQMFDDAIAALETEEATRAVLESGDADILGETVDVLARSEVENPPVKVIKADRLRAEPIVGKVERVMSLIAPLHEIIEVKRVGDEVIADASGFFDALEAGYTVQAVGTGGFCYVAPGETYKSSPVFPYPTVADAWKAAILHYERKQAKQ